jgi:hypothetical protein
MKKLLILCTITLAATFTSKGATLDDATFFAGVSLGRTEAAIDAYYL